MGLPKKIVTKITFGRCPNSRKDDAAIVEKNQDIQAVLQQIVLKVNSLDEKLVTIQNNQLILSNGQLTLVNNQEALRKKLEEIAENITLKPEMMAQTKALMECKVSIKKVEGSVCRITGEVEDVKVDKVAVLLPLGSINAVNEMEKKLHSDDFAQAMYVFMRKLKGISEDVQNVIRGIFTDDLLQMYNWEGRWEKHSFSQLSICTIMRDVFQQLSVLDFEKCVKKAIERSHNRYKQKKYTRKEKALK